MQEALLLLLGEGEQNDDKLVIWIPYPFPEAPLRSSADTVGTRTVLPMLVVSVFLALW